MLCTGLEAEGTMTLAGMPALSGAACGPGTRLTSNSCTETMPPGLDPYGVVGVDDAGRCPGSGGLSGRSRSAKDRTGTGASDGSAAFPVGWALFGEGVGSFLSVVGCEDRCDEVVLLAEGVLVAACGPLVDRALDGCDGQGGVACDGWCPSPWCTGSAAGSARASARGALPRVSTAP
ncbi:hypothetical protein GCM10010521_70240 [Streptomyces rameus]|uniref:Uncharacterized protein n=1 Tax=Streptomyces rameus TaxID=68261 RepID=A0ABP6HR50_9ACTN